MVDVVMPIVVSQIALALVLLPFIGSQRHVATLEVRTDSDPCPFFKQT